MRLFVRGLFLLIFCQVILESFPISSSGHFELLEKLLQNFGVVPITASLPDFFDHFLHGPTLLILLLFFWKDWFSIIRPLFKNFSFSHNSWSDSYKKLWAVCLKIAGLTFVPVFITVVSYFLFNTYLKNSFFLGNEYLLLFGFFVTTIVLFSLHPSIHPTSPSPTLKLRRIFFVALAKEKRLRQATQDDRQGGESARPEQSRRVRANRFEGRTHTLNFKKVTVIGIVQAVSLLPGISRFGTTYAAARWLGISARRAFQFSFLIQFPLVFVAFANAGVRFLLDKDMMRFFDLKIWVAFLFASILAFIALAISYSLAIREKLWYFGFYMLVPLLTLLYIIIPF